MEPHSETVETPDFFKSAAAGILNNKYIKVIGNTFTLVITTNWMHVDLLMLVGCIEDLRRFSGISAISRLGSRR